MRKKNAQNADKITLKKKEKEMVSNSIFVKVVNNILARKKE